MLISAKTTFSKANHCVSYKRIFHDRPRRIGVFYKYSGCKAERRTCSKIYNGMSKKEVMRRAHSQIPNLLSLTGKKGKDQYLHTQS